MGASLALFFGVKLFGWFNGRRGIESDASIKPGFASCWGFVWVVSILPRWIYFVYYTTHLKGVDGHIYYEEWSDVFWMVSGISLRYFTVLASISALISKMSPRLLFSISFNSMVNWMRLCKWSLPSVYKPLKICWSDANTFDSVADRFSVGRICLIDFELF